MMNGSNYSLSDIAAATGSNNRANDMWGGDGFSLIWLVLIFAIFGWGGFGGWGGGFGGNGGNGANGAGFQGWATRADINEGFFNIMAIVQMQTVLSRILQLQRDLQCSSFRNIRMMSRVTFTVSLLCVLVRWRKTVFSN